MAQLPAVTGESLALLTEATRLLTSARPLLHRLDELLELLQPALGFNQARLTCWLQSAQPGSARQQCLWPPSNRQLWDDALTRRVALGRNIQRQTQLPALPADTRSTMPLYLSSYMGAPIYWNGRLWGMLELRANDAEAFGEPVQEWLAALLPQLAAAIAAEGSMPQLPAPTTPTLATRSRERQERLLAVVGKELDEPMTLHRLLSTVLRWSLDSSGAEAGAVSLVDHERGELTLHVAEGYPAEMFTSDIPGHPRLRWNWESGVVGRVARSGRALLVRDVSQEPGWPNNNAHIRAELAAPIGTDGEVLAVLVLHSPRSAAFGDAELKFVSTLCQLAALPLRRALLYQEALENSTQLGQVFATMPNGLALLDIHGAVLRANPAWSHIWGLNGQHSRGNFHVPLDLTDALLPRLNDPLKLAEFCDRCQQSPDLEETLVLRLIHPVQDLHVRSVPTRDSLGQITGRLWIVRDTTHEHQVERMKHEFVSVVSHELRTPLTSILGYTELLMARDFEPDDRKQFLKT
nr:GAF domain-containing protein [Chloroflexaceae bacterium]